MESQSRPVNQILGTQPALGPVPAELVFPWAVILVVSLLLGQLLGWGWLWSGVLALGLGAAWWLLTGRESWRFRQKFYDVPNWVLGNARYAPLLEVPHATTTTPADRSEVAPGS